MQDVMWDFLLEKLMIIYHETVIELMQPRVVFMGIYATVRRFK